MEDLSLHILDIVENSVAARADTIEIRISEDEKKDLLSIEVIDNGAGMDEETVKKVLDPFYTTRTAKAANGHLSIISKKGEGTKIKADFQYSHIDRQPLGDIGQTIVILIIGYPEIDLLYVHKKNNHTYSLDTKKIRAQLQDMPINSPDGIRMIKEELKKSGSG